MRTTLWFLGLLFINILAGCQHQSTPSLPCIPREYQISVSCALTRAGENRIELLTALMRVHPDHRFALCDMIARMPNYDLTHITAQMLLDTVNSTFDTNSWIPWKLDTRSRVFLDDVLPYRISCESLEDSRPALQRMLRATIQHCETSSDAAECIVDFFTHAPQHHRYLGSAYPYDYPPLEGWQYAPFTGQVGCRAQALLLVAAMRAFGIPARLLDQASDMHSTSQHVWLLIYTIEDQKWHNVEVSHADTVRTFGMSIGHEPKMGYSGIYALPPYPKADYIGQCRYDQLTKVESAMFLFKKRLPGGYVDVTVRDGSRNVPGATVELYVWCDNIVAWYPTLTFHTDATGHAMLKLRNNRLYSKYLISASDGARCVNTVCTAMPDTRLPLTLNLAAPPPEITLPHVVL